MAQTESAEATITRSNEEDGVRCELPDTEGTIVLAFRQGYFWLEHAHSNSRMAVKFGSFDPNAQYSLETREGETDVLKKLVECIIPHCREGSLLDKDCWLGLKRMRVALSAPAS